MFIGIETNNNNNETIINNNNNNNNNIKQFIQRQKVFFNDDKLTVNINTQQQ